MRKGLKKMYAQNILAVTCAAYGLVLVGACTITPATQQKIDTVCAQLPVADAVASAVAPSLASNAQVATADAVVAANVGCDIATTLPTSPVAASQPL